MSELEKKAKMGNFIKDLVLRYDSAKEHLWVRLEDAQKEIKIGGDYCERLMKILEHKDKERLELKRKLDAFHGFLVKLHNQSRDVKVNAFLGGIIKKFEELKEEKEA